MIESDIKYIVIHASATPVMMDIGVDTIREWHTFPRYVKSRKQLHYLGHYYSSELDLPEAVQHQRGRGWSDIIL